MDEQEIKRKLAEQWPLVKALAEGKTVQGRLKDMKGALWTRIVPAENVQFNFDRVDYRVKEDLAVVLQQYMTEALLTAYKTSTMGELDRLRENVGTAIARIIEENT